MRDTHQRQQPGPGQFSHNGSVNLNRRTRYPRENCSHTSNLTAHRDAPAPVPHERDPFAVDTEIFHEVAAQRGDDAGFAGDPEIARLGYRTTRHGTRGAAGYGGCAFGGCEFFTEPGEPGFQVEYEVDVDLRFAINNANIARAQKHAPVHDVPILTRPNPTPTA